VKPDIATPAKVRLATFHLPEDALRGITLRIIHLVQ
jgi:hypothetical protein